MKLIACSSCAPFVTAASYCQVSPPVKGHDAELAMEITVLSAQDLKNPSSPLLPGRRLRPFVVLFAAPAPSLDYDSLPPPLYRTRVDERGEHSPAWGDKICLPLDPSFPRAAASATGGCGEEEEAGVYLFVLSKRPLGSPARVGWCRIPTADVLDGLRQPSALRRLSYALRSPRHGGRGHGVVHVAVRLLGRDLDHLLAPPPPRPPREDPGWYRVAIGIPVAAPAASFLPRGWAGGGGVDCAQSGGFGEGRVSFGVGFDFRSKY